MMKASFAVLLVLFCHASMAGLHITTGPGMTVSANGHMLSVSGHWVNSGRFDARNSTVAFQGAGRQLLSNPNGEILFNVIVDNDSGLALECDLAIGGTLVLAKGNLLPQGHQVTMRDVIKPRFTSPDSDTAYVGRPYGYRIQYDNPVRGTVSFTYPQNNPQWLRIGPDTLWGKPSSAGLHVAKVILSVNEVGYDTLELHVYVMDQAGLAYANGEIPKELGLVAQASSRGIDFTVSIDQPGDFNLSVYDMVGRKAWEFSMLDAAPGLYHPGMTFEKPHARTSGMYLVFLKHQERQIARKVWLVR